jgi:hypothetical protein
MDMTADRSRAYAHVMHLVEDLSASKLHPDEQAAIREAADALLFTTDMAADSEAKLALSRAEDVVERLVENDRVLRETGEALLDAVEAVGPQPLPA